MQVILQAKLEGISGLNLGAHESLMDNGIDSLTAMEFRTSLQKELGPAIALPSTVIFNYPTMAEISQFVYGSLESFVLEDDTGRCDTGSSEEVHPQSDDQTASIAPEVAREPKFASTSQSIAPPVAEPSISIVGMACFLAGCANTPCALWSSLQASDTYITSSPPVRWRQVCMEAGAPSAILHGAFLDQFLLSQKCPADNGSGPSVDHHMHALLEMASGALCDAGWFENQIRAQCIGVFTACQTSDFIVPLPSFWVARSVAGMLGTDGPQCNVEATCSSGYLGIEKAMREIRNGECASAVVSGVLLMLKAEYPLGALSFKTLSPSGQMCPLSSDADGMVLGEGCCAVVLDSTASNTYCTMGSAAHTSNSALTPLGWADDQMMEAAARQALHAAGIGQPDVAFTHLHAMGNPNSDIPELLGIEAALASSRVCAQMWFSCARTLKMCMCAGGFATFGPNEPQAHIWAHNLRFGYSRCDCSYTGTAPSLCASTTIYQPSGASHC